MVRSIREATFQFLKRCPENLCALCISVLKLFLNGKESGFRGIRYFRSSCFQGEGAGGRIGRIVMIRVNGCRLVSGRRKLGGEIEPRVHLLSMTGIIVGHELLAVCAESAI